MIQGFWTAKSALIAHQEHMNTISNNLANVNTYGFKPMRSAFTDLIYQNLNRDEVENEVLIGHGVKINKNDPHMAEGALKATGFDLDFAILDGENAFFAVQDERDQVFYTRAGDFRLSLEDDVYFLVNGNGEKVLDAEGQPIEVEVDENTQQMQFDPATIGVYTFTNPYGLSLSGLNRFVPTDTSGEPEALEQPRLKRGYVEGSGTEMAKEMADVIEASKAFSFASRMVQVADEVEQTVNSLRN